MCGLGARWLALALLLFGEAVASDMCTSSDSRNVPPTTTWSLSGGVLSVEVVAFAGSALFLGASEAAGLDAACTPQAWTRRLIADEHGVVDCLVAISASWDWGAVVSQGCAAGTGPAAHHPSTVLFVVGNERTASEHGTAECRQAVFSEPLSFALQPVPKSQTKNVSGLPDLAVDTSFPTILAYSPSTQSISAHIVVAVDYPYELVGAPFCESVPSADCPTNATFTLISEECTAGSICTNVFEFSVPGDYCDAAVGIPGHAYRLCFYAQCRASASADCTDTTPGLGSFLIDIPADLYSCDTERTVLDASLHPVTLLNGVSMFVFSDVDPITVVVDVSDDSVLPLLSSALAALVVCEKVTRLAAELEKCAEGTGYYKLEYDAGTGSVQTTAGIQLDGSASHTLETSQGGPHQLVLTFLMSPTTTDTYLRLEVTVGLDYGDVSGSASQKKAIAGDDLRSTVSLTSTTRTVIQMLKRPTHQQQHEGRSRSDPGAIFALGQCLVVLAGVAMGAALRVGVGRLIGGERRAGYQVVEDSL